MLCEPSADNINHIYKKGDWYSFICDYCNGIHHILINDDETKTKEDIIKDLKEHINKECFYIPIIDLRNNKTDYINYRYNNIYDFLKDYSNILNEVINNDEYKTKEDIYKAFNNKKMGRFDID